MFHRLSRIQESKETGACPFRVVEAGCLGYTPGRLKVRSEQGSRSLFYINNFNKAKI